MRAWGIRPTVLLAAVLPALVLASLLSAYFISSRFADLDESLHSRGRAIAQQLAAASEYGVFAGNIAVLEALAEAALREPDVSSVEILDADGRRFAARSAPASALDASHALRFEAPIPRRAAQLEDYVERAAPRPPAEIGRVVLELSRRSLSERKRSLALTGAALLLAVLAGSVLLAIVMSRRVSEPILAIARGVEAIGQGDLEARVQVQGHGALKQLADGVNVMAAKLQSARDDLRRRVDEATRQLLLKKEEAERADRAKSRFLAAASHDLRQPLHALGLFVADLTQCAGSDEVRRLAGNIAASADALEKLLDALLDISRLDSGSLRTEISAFPAQALLDQVQAQWSEPARSKGLRLRCRPSALWVTSDQALLERILANLVSNAVRYTAQGSVLVACRRRGARVLIEVRDSGIGMAAKDHALIFQEFVQLHNPQRDRAQGIGLGLAIVERLARLLGHRLRLASAPGRGSTFAIELPRAKPRPLAPAAAPVAGERLMRGCLVAVIEDDALALASMQGLLESWQCRVVAGTDEDGVMQRLLAMGEQPCLLVCDYRLGGERDGIAVVQRMRAAYDCALPGIVITGDTAPAIQRAAKAADCHLLHKPVRPARLRALMERLIAYCI